ncbi:MAG: NAD(P)-dependent alcohol dehydrogenase [Anaerolineae bacterium]|nr:NAD(P)-dependent alcohol dehydrogenase [Anaerolineae bacterium]
MKVIQIQDNWSIDNLTLTERPKPEPGPGQVLLRMKAASLNYRDLVVPRRGYGRLTGELPLIPISDGVGEVVAVGEGVSRVQVGDRVCPIMIQSWISGEPTTERLLSTLGGPLDGVMAEYMALSEQRVVIVPPHLSDEQAATLPCAALTAWSAVVTEGRVKAGDKVLIQGTGGVSLFALQFAKLQGAHVIVTSSRDEKLQRALDLGADDGINYISTPEWGKAAKSIAGGDGLDHIVEVGGTDTLPQSLRAIRAGGTLSLIGVLSGLNMNASLGPIVTRQVRLQGISVGNRDGFEAMVRAIALHTLRPVVDHVFAFEELRPALDYLASSAHFGKICIRH